jgi:hypothetical protein
MVCNRNPLWMREDLKSIGARDGRERDAGGIRRANGKRGRR